MMTMIIMAAETNNDSSNIKWSVEVVLQSGCSVVFGCFSGDIGVR